MIALDLLDYSDLPLGETKYGKCPTCGKSKFYVTRKNGGLAYICFRAACPTQGFVGESSSHAPRAKSPKRTSEYTDSLFLPSAVTINYFLERFNIDLGSIKDASYWVKETGDGRYAFSVLGQRDESRGIVLRRASWQGMPSPLRETCYKHEPKARTFLEYDVPKAGWYHSMSPRTVVIVEDQVSAMRIAGLGITAYALLGTHFNDKHFYDILSWGKARVIIALDPDAFGKSLQISAKWGSGLHKGMEVARLKEDPKDYRDDDELERDLKL